MQIWATEWEDKERFKMKVIYSGTDKETWQQFYYLTVQSMNTSNKAELWLMEEDNDGVLHTKAKFIWQRH